MSFVLFGDLEFFLDIVFVALLAVSGYHFANESCEEKLESEDHRQQSQIEERLVGDRSEIQASALLYELFCNDPDRHKASDKEHKYACKAEEMHRFLAKSAQKPR